MEVHMQPICFSCLHDIAARLVHLHFGRPFSSAAAPPLQACAFIQSELWLVTERRATVATFLDTDAGVDDFNDTSEDDTPDNQNNEDGFIDDSEPPESAPAATG